MVLICVAAAIVLCFAAGAAINAHVINSTEALVYTLDEIDEIPKADCALVLGAKVYEDGTLSPILRDRVDYGIMLYERGVVPKILLSGDHGTKGYDEVNAMKNYCLDKGVPKEDIFLDHAGFCTYDSAVRAKEIFQCESVVVVTQRFHISRAIYDARGVGLTAVGFSADPREYTGQMLRESREWLARVKDFLSIELLKPEPKYLGEAIPIWGDSMASWDEIGE